MRTTGVPLRVTVATALAAVAVSADEKPLVSSKELQDLITTEDLVAGSQVLQDLADAHGGNRAFGGGGHNATADYLFETLSALDGYYDVVKQPFTELYFAGTAELSVVGGDEYPASAFTYTPAGEISGAAVAAVAELGCDVENFPAEVEGKVAIIQRGECPFAQKVTNAKAAGAVAAIIYNNDPDGQIAGTLGQGGDYVPVVGVTQAAGLELLALLEGDGEPAVDITVDAVTENRTNFNVIAETRGGDKDNVLVLGGHSDSVPAGPGINDDGSGTIGILNVAVALSQFSVNNAVRFAFWGAEEFGKLGSYYYVKQLNGTGSEGGDRSEIDRIRAYLNFDMVSLILLGCMSKCFHGGSTLMRMFLNSRSQALTTSTVSTTAMETRSTCRVPRGRRSWNGTSRSSTGRGTRHSYRRSLAGGQTTRRSSRTGSRREGCSLGQK